LVFDPSYLLDSVMAQLDYLKATWLEGTGHLLRLVGEVQTCYPALAVP
jgi:hypothetical protein